MRTRRQFPSVPLSLDRSWQTDLEGDAITSLNVRMTGEYLTSGVGITANEIAFGYLGTITLMQDGETILEVDGRDLRHIGAFMAGGYGDLNPALTLVDTAASKGVVIAHVLIPFNAFLAGAAVDGSKSKIVAKGRFRTAPFFGDTCTGISGDLQLATDTVELPRNPQGEASYYLPHWNQVVSPMAISKDNSFTIRPKGERLYLPGIMLRQFDASREFTNANVARTDALVRSVWGVLVKNNRKGEIFRYTWGELKMLQTTALVGFSRGDVHTGVAYVPLREEKNGAFGECLILEEGESLEIHYDTAGTPEFEFSSVADVTLDNVVANGDQLFATVFGHVGRGPAFGSNSRRLKAIAG